MAGRITLNNYENITLYKKKVNYNELGGNIVSGIKLKW